MRQPPLLFGLGHMIQKVMIVSFEIIHQPFLPFQLGLMIQKIMMMSFEIMCQPLDGQFCILHVFVSVP